MGRKHKSFPDEREDKTKALRKKIKEQDAEIRRLKSELRTLNKAFEKTAIYIKGNLDGVSVDKVITAVKEDRTMIEIKSDNKCTSCGGEIKLGKLPFGKLEICTAGCGYRKVENDGN